MSLIRAIEEEKDENSVLYSGIYLSNKKLSSSTRENVENTLN